MAGACEHVMSFEARGSVVLEGLAEDRVVLGAVHIGTRVCGHKGHHGHPAHRDHGGKGTGERDMSDADAKPRGGCQQVRDGQGGQDQPRHRHLCLKCESHPHTRQQQRAEPAAEQRCRGGIRREHEQQDQERVGDVAAVQRDGDRAGCERRSGCDAREWAGQAPHRAIQDEDREHALDDLWQHDRPYVKADDPQQQRLWPERAG
jgi:hypothetical protein